MIQKPMDKKSKKKHTKCMFLLLIPVFFFSADLVMGKRGKNSGYTKLGIFYGISSLITFIISALGLVWPVLFNALISHFIVWALCTIHTLNCREQYQQYAQWAEEDQNRSELTQQPSFRLHNAYWTFWDYIPLMGGFATCFMGAKMGNKKLQWFGALSTLVVAGLFFYLTMLEQVTSALLIAICVVVAYCSICIHPLIAVYYFEDYLDAAAAQWEADVREYPQLENRSWRMSNSFWQLFTLIPSFGSIGLFWAGITRENGKVLLRACILCILEVGFLAVPSVIMGNEALLQAMPVMEGVAAGINALGIFIYALVVFTGALIRQDMLCIRAQQEMEF